MVKKKYCEERHEVKNAYSSYEKSEKLIDFKMNTELKDGLVKMWDWAKKQPNRERKKWSSYELNKNIYDYWK